MTPPAAALHRRHRLYRYLWRTVFLAAITVVLGALVGGVWLFSNGWRLTTVATPSMSPAIPVGALVITAPLREAGRVGEVIVFRPPGDSHTYIHKIVASLAGPSYHTKGNNDPQPDPWTIPAGNVTGRVAVVVPDLGYLVFAAPILAVAILIGAIVGLLYPRWRRWAIVDSISAAIWLTSLRLHPLVRWQVISVTHLARQTHTWVFDTGILPIRVEARPGTTAGIAPGHSAIVTSPLGHPFTIVGMAHLTSLEWLVLAVICALPMIAALLLASGRRPGTTDHDIPHGQLEALPS